MQPVREPAVPVFARGLIDQPGRLTRTTKRVQPGAQLQQRNLLGRQAVGGGGERIRRTARLTGVAIRHAQHVVRGRGLRVRLHTTLRVRQQVRRVDVLIEQGLQTRGVEQKVVRQPVRDRFDQISRFVRTLQVQQRQRSTPPRVVVVLDRGLGEQRA